MGRLSFDKLPPCREKHPTLKDVRCTGYLKHTEGANPERLHYARVGVKLVSWPSAVHDEVGAKRQ
jgi:hypothetical protein